MISLSSTLAKLLLQLNMSLFLCTHKHKAFQYYYLPTEDQELEVEQLREPHGRPVFYLQALAVNISTTELQMKEQFLESQPSVSARQKRVAIVS